MVTRPAGRPARQTMYMTALLQNLLLITAGQGFFLALLLGIRSRDNRSARIPAALVLLCSLDLLQRYLAIRGAPFSDDLLLFSYPLGFLYGPLFLMDARVRTGARESLSRWDALHALPYVFYIAISVYYFETTGVDTPSYVEALRSFRLPWWMLFLEFTVFPWILAYLIASQIHLRRFRERLRKSCSSTERLELGWLRKLHGLFAIVCVAASLAFATLFVYDDAFSEQVGLLAYAAMVAIIYLIGYFAILHPEVLAGNAQVAEARYERNRLADDELDEYLARIQSYTRDSRIYLEPELKLDEFAKRTGLPPHYISQTINRRGGRNFYRFINEYRVTHAREALRQPEHNEKTILRIALDSGFNSKATFNAVFKEYTGVSPSVYRRSGAATR